ncbi:hypothetical protein [Halobellus rufus]|uniref:hypothetical protein n=1 Tax=Halobellus rufus TaxID=1448860 RepID=UPI000679A576|nr:hypothetical protein [Halobellus rufus]
MSGSGSTPVAFGKEAEFNGALVNDADPDYYLSGRNTTIEEIELPRALERLSDPDVVEAIESIAGRIEGAFQANWAVAADVHEHVRDIVFNDGGTGFTHGQAATSKWFIGVDHLSGTVERALGGVTPTDYSLSYNDDQNTITASLTAIYASESKSASITPANIIGPETDSTVPFHGFSLDVDGATVKTLQSATLSISNIAQFITGPESEALDAVIAEPTTDLQFNAIIDGPDHIELAYGGGGQSVDDIQDSVGAVPGTITLSQAGADVATYDLPRIEPDTYSWSDLVSSNPTTEDINAHVNGGLTVSAP